MLNFSKKTLIAAVVGLILASIFFLLINSSNDIYGNFVFEETIYNSPISSFFMAKEHAPTYEITKNSLIITEQNGDMVEIEGEYLKSKVNEDSFKALFFGGLGVPDISSYNKRYEYSLNAQYSLYIMDNELWLVNRANDIIWSIYKLEKWE